jgi:hypothetical protein
LSKHSVRVVDIITGLVHFIEPLPLRVGISFNLVHPIRPYGESAL